MFTLLEAATSEEALVTGRADLYSSGLMPFVGPNHRWSGSPPASRSRIHWRVALLSAANDLVRWSEVASFEVPLLRATDWGAQWIAHPDWWSSEGPIPPWLPVLSRAFVVARNPRSARLYVAGGGVFEATLNGRLVGEALLSPGYATTAGRVGGAAWDVSADLVVGTNRLELSLGTGMSLVSDLPARYTKLTSDVLRPRAIAQMEWLDDKGFKTIASDDSWHCHLGATSVAHWYGGEDYDARREHSAGSSEPVHVLGDADLHEIWWPGAPEVRVQDRLVPLTSIPSEEGFIVDFGLNIAGRPRLQLPDSPAGSVVRLWPSELLDPQGNITQGSTGEPIWDQYTTRAGRQDWAPRFVYHGFRYLKVEGLGFDDALSVSAEVMHASNNLAGTFETDDPFLNRLHAMIVRSVRGNMFGVFTDCPHREKLGWLEQLHLCFNVLARSYDVQAHLRDMLFHMRDAQFANGGMPSIAPESVDFSGISHLGDENAFREDPNWGGALVIVAWRLYETYGDIAALEETWPAIIAYLAYLDLRSDHGVVDFGLGDWIALDPSTPRAMVATYGYIRILDAAISIASALKQSTYGAMLKSTRLAVAQAFLTNFSSTTRTDWGSGSQGSLALALDLGVVPLSNRSSVLRQLVSSITAEGHRVTVGEIALPALIRVLHSAGRDDVIGLFVRNGAVSGYGYQVASGATTLAESWTGRADPAIGGGSQNHFMLGMIDDWLQSDLLGMRQLEGSVGWRNVHVRPTLVHGVSRMQGTFESPLGLVSVAWTNAAEFTLAVTIPPGARGTVDVPETSGSAATASDGSRGRPISVGRRRFEIGPGTVNFVSSKQVNSTTER